MEDPTKKWTQQNLMNLAATRDRRDFSKTMHFVDDMMRLKDAVFTAQSIQRTIHYYATSNEPITNEIYSYVVDEEVRRFRSTCSSIIMECINSYPKEIYSLNLTKANTAKLLTQIKAVHKFINQIENNPQNDRDLKVIIKKNVQWKWNK